MTTEEFGFRAKSIWNIFCGRGGGNLEVVRDTLHHNKNRIKSGLHYWKKSTSKDWPPDAAVTTENKEFISKLSKMMEVGESQCWEMYLSYILCEYRSDESSLSSMMSSVAASSLAVDVWAAYRAERLMMLTCLKHLLTGADDQNHCYHVAFAEFTRELLSGHTLINSLIVQLKQVTSCATLPGREAGPWFTEDCQRRWVWFTLREQLELLNIILIYYQLSDVPAGTPQQFIELFHIFESHEFGMRQSFRQHLHGECENLNASIGFVESIILLQLMSVEVFISPDINSEIVGQSHALLCDEAKFAEIHKLMQGLGRLPQHSIPLTGWLILLTFTQQRTNLNKITHALANNSALQYINSSLHIINLQGSEEGIHMNSIVYNLILVLLSCFDENSAVFDDSSLTNICSHLLTHGTFAEDFWQYSQMRPPIGICGFFNKLERSLPMPEVLPLWVKMLTALASSGEASAEKVVARANSLKFYTEKLEKQSSSITHSGGDIYTLTSAREVRAGIRLAQYTAGELISKQQWLIRWSVPYSGWGVLLEDAQILYQQISCGWSHVDAKLVESVGLTVKLLTKILHNSPESSHQLDQFKDVLTNMFIKFLHCGRECIDIVVVLLEYMTCIVQLGGLETWHQLTRAGVLSHTVGQSGTGKLGELMAANCVNGQHHLTIAFLDLLGSAVKHPPLLTSGGVCACLQLVMSEILPSYHSWRYSSTADRIALPQLCLDIIHTVLNSATAAEELTTVHQMIISKLYCDEASQALLHIVTTDEVVINVALEQQLNWSTGAGVQLIQLISSALQLTTKTLQLRHKLCNAPNKNAEVTARCSVITSSSSCLDTSLTSHTAGQTHHILTISHLLYHQHDNMLTTTALILLKKLATEYPLSLLACLGSEAETMREMFLLRLQSPIETEGLKTAALEFLTACVTSQPGLIEMLLHLRRRVEADTGESCLHIVMHLLQRATDGTPESNLTSVVLRRACLEFLHSLWLHETVGAIAEVTGERDFWKTLLSFLYTSEDDLISSSHVFRIVALNIYSHGGKGDRNLHDQLNLFHKQGYIKKWSKKLCDSTVEWKSRVVSADERSIVISWREFLVMLAKEQPLSISNEEKYEVTNPLLQASLVLCNTDAGVNTSLIQTLLQSYLMLLNTWKRQCISDKCVWLQDLTLLVTTYSTMYHPQNESTVRLIAVILLSAFSLIKDQDQLQDSLVALVVPLCSMFVASISLLEKCVTSPDTNTSLSTRVQLSSHLMLTMSTLLLHAQSSEQCLHTLHQHSIIHITTSTANHLMQFSVARPVCVSILQFLITVASSPSGAQAVLNAGLSANIWLPLSKYTKQNDPLLTLSSCLCCHVLHHTKHHFVGEALSYVSMHCEALMQAVAHGLQTLQEEDLQATLTTVGLIAHLSNYTQQWRVQHSAELQHAIGCVLSCIESSMGLLLRPSAVQMLLESGANQWNVVSSIEPTLQRTRSISIHEPDPELPPNVLKIQDKLCEVISVSLSTLSAWSPPLLSMLLGCDDVTQWTLLLEPSFATHSLEHNSNLSYGTLLSAINYCTRKLCKVERSVTSPVRSGLTRHASGSSVAGGSDVSKHVLDVLQKSLVFVISQACLLLLYPDVDHRVKASVKRDLGSELSCTMSMLSKMSRRGLPSPSGRSSVLSTSTQLSSCDQDFFKTITHVLQQVFK